MLTYKDKTFCNHKDCAKFKECPDAFTEEIRNGAMKWWDDFYSDLTDRGKQLYTILKGSPPISLYLHKPDCYEEER